jgi:hypothetical protein
MALQERESPGELRVLRLGNGMVALRMLARRKALKSTDAPRGRTSGTARRQRSLVTGIRLCKWTSSEG